MSQILESTEQVGRTFTGFAGLGQILLHGAISGKSYTLQANSGVDIIWVDTDVSFDGNGLQTFYTVPDWKYRMSAEDAASIGAQAFFKILGL